MIVDAHINGKETTQNCFHVISIQGLIHKLGCSEEGFPKFFILTEEYSDIIKNLYAELLSVEYDVLCNVIEDDRTVTNQRFTIITLRSENELLQKTFTDLFLIMLRMLPTKPTKKTIAVKIESLISIFAKIKHRPTHKLQGLWAEMLLIARSSDPQTIAKAWHSSPSAKYDFTIGENKIEVKSTSNENRVHHFSLDQLNPAKNSNLLICSVILRESGKGTNGVSVFDLYDKISNRISDDEIRLHIYNVMLETLGSDFYQAKTKCFDYSGACNEIAFFDCNDVPKIDKNYIPELVSEIRFSSDLSHLKDIRNNICNKYDNPLFNSIFSKNERFK